MRALVAMLALLSCSDAEPVTRLEGVWETGWELNRFREEGHEYGPYEGWCLVADGKGGRPLDAISQSVPGQNTEIKVRIVIEGRVSEAREYGYGHMGSCEREVRVTRIIASELIARTPYVESSGH